MDIGSIFLILAILIPVIIFLYRPFLERSTPSASKSEQDYSSLLAQRDELVASLQELDDDFHLGKIPAENYIPQRQNLLRTGVEILRQLDAYQVTTSPIAAEERLEAAIEVRRKNGNAVPPIPDDDLEQKIASRRRLRQSKAGGFCPKCGKPVQEMDRFCPRCGATLI